LAAPQIARVLVAPRRLFEEYAASAVAKEPSWLDVLGALSAPVAIVGASVAFGYAHALLVGHYVANVMLLAASFGIQSFAAAFTGRILYRRSARVTLLPFSATLVAHELFFVAVTALTLLSPSGGTARIGVVLALTCSVWNVFLTYACFRALDEARRAGARARLRAAGAVLFHFGTIAVLVGIYMHVHDLLPYPPGRR
jgi:hypothetical protein